MKHILISYLFLHILLGLNAQTLSDKTQRLENNWQHIRQDVGGIWEVVRNKNEIPKWQNVNIPHCFNAEDAVDPDIHYYEGPGWYKTKLSINNPYQNGRTLLHFEGAGQKSDVYIGMEHAAKHIGGYDEWSVDITDQIKRSLNDARISKIYKDKVALSVRCDNSRDLEMIPSDLSDFNVYGGLYRYVNLVYLPEHYIKRVYILPSSNKKRGKVEFTITTSDAAKINAELIIKDRSRNIVASLKLNNLSGERTYNTEINNIELWDVTNPCLYTVEIKTDLGQTYRDNFGFRDFRFEEKGPFYLNGNRLLLRGTHRHEDYAGVGAAMTEEMIRQEMIMMKEMGVNFIRLGHYQQSRIVLNLCDSLGILVWEEIPWCRGGLGGESYKQMAREALSNMIDQHYNHPSVIIWGLGNENDWKGDFAEWNQQAIRNFMQELNILSHRMDPHRKTAIRRCEFCKDIVDVYSPSIWAGWYRGKFTEYKSGSYKAMKTVNHFLHVEYGGSSHAYRHDENPDKGLEDISTGNGVDERDGDAQMKGGGARVSKDGNWSETYICNLFDWHLKEQLTMPWLTGAAQWAFKDFSTPVRPENPIPYMNQKGLVQRDLTPKESYYVFQSYWSEKPMAHIYGHTWPVRWGDKEELKLVKVYSNCDKAELYLNNISLGTKERDAQDYPAAGLRWKTSFKEGKNTLKVVAYKNKTIVIDSIDFEYQTQKWSKPYRLEIREVKRDGDYLTLEAKIYDKDNVFCPDANNMVEFGATGDGYLIQNMGTASGSRKIGLANGRAIIKAKISGDAFVVSVKSQGIKTAFVTIK